MNTLIEKARAGDSRAMDDLIKLARRSADRAVSRVLLNREDRLDASQEAVINALTKLDTFKGKSSFTTWVYQIAKNTAVDMYRRLYKGGGEVRMADLESVSRYDTASFDPARLMVVKEAVDSLPANLKKTVLCVISGEDCRETARKLSVTNVTVRTRMHKARKLLRAHLN